MKLGFLIAMLGLISSGTTFDPPVLTESERASVASGEIVESRSRGPTGLNQRVIGVVEAPLSWIATEVRALCRPGSKRVSASRLLVSQDVAALLALPPEKRTQEAFSMARAGPCVLAEGEAAAFVYSEAKLPLLGRKWTVLRYQFETTKEGAVVITTTSVAGDLGTVEAVVVLRALDQHRTLYASSSTFKVPFPVPDLLWKREPSEGAERIRMLREASARRLPRTGDSGGKKAP